MVIDSSAIVAIAENEPEREAFLELVAGDVTRAISAATVLESMIVLMRRKGPDRAVAGEQVVNDIVLNLRLAIEPVTESQVSLAARAYRTYGKGFHPAGLNYGDCFAYALAREMGEPLLYKGRDFAGTDIESVL